MEGIVVVVSSQSDSFKLEWLLSGDMTNSVLPSCPSPAVHFHGLCGSSKYCIRLGWWRSAEIFCSFVWRDTTTWSLLKQKLQLSGSVPSLNIKKPRETHYFRVDRQLQSLIKIGHTRRGEGSVCFFALFVGLDMWPRSFKRQWVISVPL